MSLFSCDKCGIVLDGDKLAIIKTHGFEREFVHSDGTVTCNDKIVPVQEVKCPLCGTFIEVRECKR